MKPLPAASGPHPSRHAISEYLAGDASPDARAALEAHAAACADCAAALREAQAARDAFAARYPSLEYFAATRRARSAPSSPGFAERLRSLWARGWSRPAFAFAAVLLLALIVRQPWRSTPPDLSAKGTARMELFVNGNPVGDTVACKPGDTLQLALVAEKPVYYAILYRDDGGPLEAYMEEGRGAPLGRPDGENLPHSLILRPGWTQERLYCVWSATPFEAQAARDRAEGRPAGFLNLRVFLLHSP